MTKEIYKYPYNARTEDEIKVFLSDKICEQVVKVNHKNGQIFCTIKDRITSQNKEIIFSTAILFGVVFGMPYKAKGIGVSPILPSAPEIHRSARQTVPQHAPIINPRLDKIVMMANNYNNHMIPLIYINGHYSYINEQLLKKLRAGDLSANLTIVAIGVVIYVMCQLSGVDAFAIFDQIGKWNAPQPSTGFGLAPTSTSTQLSVIPTKAQEFNDMSLKFNQPKTSYNFVMSDQEAKRQVNEMYSGVLEISPNRHISDVKAAGKIYHASQLGVCPEDYGMKNEDVKRINEIGIYNYAKEGRPLPPIELIKDYQMAMKDICTNGKLLEGTYSSKAEQKIHKAIYKYDMQTRKVVGFHRETGELITATKYKESTFQNFILTKNLGTLN